MMKKKCNALLLILTLTVFSAGNIFAADAIRKGGTLVVPAPYGNAFTTLDIIRTAELNTMMVAENIFEGLVEYDNVTSIPEPAIAEKWDISADNMVYTFFLHKGVKFHHGREVTAQDFKYSFERLANPDTGAYNAATLKNIKGYEAFVNKESDQIKGITVIDDYTLRIELGKPDAEFLYQLAVVGGGDVVPKEEVERLGRDFTIKPVAAGPFKLKSFSGNEVVLEAFEDYYKKGPYIDSIVFRPMGESITRQAAFESEEIDISNVSTTQYESYSKRYKDQMIEVAEFYIRLIGFNMAMEKFQDKRVRQAFNYAVDKELIVEKYYRNKAYPAVGRIPTSMASFNPTLAGYPYNPEKAKALLKEAGYENGFEIEIIGSEASTYGIPAVEAAMPYLAKAGFKVKAVTLDEGTLWDRIVKGEYEAFISSLGGEPSPTTHIGRNTSDVSRGGGNYTAYSNPAMDEIMAMANKETDTEKRMQFVMAAESLFVEDPPYFFYNYNKAVLVYHPWVHGLVPTPAEIMYQPFEKVWIDSDSPRAEN